MQTNISHEGNFKGPRRSCCQPGLEANRQRPLGSMYVTHNHKRISIPLCCCVVGGHTDLHCLNRFEDWVSSCLFSRDFSPQAYDEFMVHAESGLGSLVASGMSPLPGGD